MIDVNKQVKIAIEYKGERHESALFNCDPDGLIEIDNLLKKALSGQIDCFYLDTEGGGKKFFPKKILQKSIIELIVY